MANDGCVNLILKVDSTSRELVGNIQIESRGFVYSKEVRSVHTKIVEYVKSRYRFYAKKRMETKDIMRAIKDDLGTFVERELGRSPMIIPMYVYISRDGDVAVPAKPAAKKKPAPKKKVVAKKDTEEKEEGVVKKVMKKVLKKKDEGSEGEE